MIDGYQTAMCMLYFFKAWKFIIEKWERSEKEEDKVEGKLYVQYLSYMSIKKKYYLRKSLNINKNCWSPRTAMNHIP